jgi:hypothetical protein
VNKASNDLSILKDSLDFEVVEEADDEDYGDGEEDEAD